MAEGIALFNSGDNLNSAANLFGFAFGAAGNNMQKKVDALEQQALVFTKMNRFSTAELLFVQAMALASQHALDRSAYTIRRNLAINCMAEYQRSLFHTHKVWRSLLTNAYELLQQCSYGFKKIVDEPEELAITKAYIGRLHLLERLYEPAAKKMREARDELEGFTPVNYTYVLNVDIALMRAVPKSERAAVRDHALPLIELTGQTSRYREIKVIMLGGDRLYRIVQRVPTGILKIAAGFFGK
ncbi:MAG: hypothetical protein ABIP50_03845 [Candidatus Saccharimonadales bacterium]